MLGVAFSIVMLSPVILLVFMLSVVVPILRLDLQILY